MRIARFAVAGGDPTFGIVELAEDQGEHPDTIAAISGDPLVGPVTYTGERHVLDEVRLLAPVIPRSKLVGAAANYVADAAELVDRPAFANLFFKPNTTVVGPDDAIIRPAEVSSLAFEGELAVVIGRICRDVPAERVDEVIFGYTVANDVTAASLSKERPGAYVKGWDTFCPLGPWIVTHLNSAQVADLNITTRIDGEVRQDDSTALLKIGVPELVAQISHLCTLLPGDVILTGTPVGAGVVEPGQLIEITVEGVGTLTNRVVEDEPAGESAE